MKPTTRTSARQKAILKSAATWGVAADRGYIKQSELTPLIARGLIEWRDDKQRYYATEAGRAIVDRAKGRGRANDDKT